MFAIGTKLGPYEILDQLGAGGMGVVYRARDTRLQRDVAIKVLPLGMLGDDLVRARFRREALALAKLNHPNVATLYDVGEQDDVSYIVMECVAGESLADKIARGPLPVSEVVSLGIEIAGALEEAHERGIVHRDLKPANVIVTPKGYAKVLDFGLAKLFARSEADATVASVTQTAGVVGTLHYMSPEQATGETVDARSDLWSLGVLLYELLDGAVPFRGAGTLNILTAITQSSPAPLSSRRGDVPPALEALIARALSKRAEMRQGSAAEMRRELVEIQRSLATTAGPSGKPRRHSSVFAAAGFVVLLIAVTGGWFWQRAEHLRWAQAAAPREAAALAAHDQPLAALLLLKKAQAYAPNDSLIAQRIAAAVDSVSVQSTPAGASIEIQDYLAADTSAWLRVGTTPADRVVIPKGYFRWRLRLPNSALVVAPPTRKVMRFALDSAAAAPAGMVFAPARSWGDLIAFVGWVGPYDLPSFYIDRFEVTNKEFQKFVDAGGYERREWWADTLRDGARTLTWAEAQTRLRDSSGRPGPSTWTAGHFPGGRDDYPVQGVSWYEASAYAKWAGKSLPTMAQWYYAAPPEEASYTVRVSNISREHVARGGAFSGVGPFGTYDMAGNVKEWVSNPIGDRRRLLLGGAWTSLSYLYSEPEALSPFDRSGTNGFRCVRNLAEVPAAAAAAIQPLERDFAHFTPASDEVFRAYRAMYEYDHTPLGASIDGAAVEAANWRRERVSFRTAYGSRMTAYLFLPKRVEPPYQTVVFFPSARVLDIANSATLGDTSFFDYIVQSGRAVMYPVYQDTYERKVRGELPGASQQMTLFRSQDLARSLDYLATRADIDTSRFAYLGVSMGAAEGVIYSTLLQERIKTDLFLDGGYFLGKPSTGRDQADFAPRLAIPVLMVNGKYDFSFSVDRAQEPLFRMLGTPAAQKRHVLLDAPHDVGARRPEMMKEVLDWLDRYLGPVR
jgi:tRNA A-37 threonylcarbamoyl transferase component Bud32/dienelactone hydrolase